MENSTSCIQTSNSVRCTISSFLVVAGLCAATTACTKKEANQDKIVEYSYALGAQAGEGFKTQGLKIDADEYMRGFQDAYAGKSELSAMEAQKLVVDAQIAHQQAIVSQYKEREDQGRAYLEKNAQRKEVKQLNAGLQYEVLNEGKGIAPKQIDRVALYLKGSLVDGTVFENDFETKKSRNLSVIELIPGIRTGVQLMKAGGRYRFFIAPEQAYGLRGTKDVPPQSVVIYDVELAQVVPAAKTKK